MTPDGVLSDDQKQIRFRKLLQKKRKNAASVSEPSSTAANPEFKHEPVEETSDFGDTHSSCGSALVKYEPCQSKKIKLEPDCFREIKYFTSKRKQTKVSPHRNEDDILQELRQNLENLTDEIHRTFLQAKLKCQSTNLMFDNSSTYHQDGVATSRSDVDASIANLVEHFQHFASLQRYFSLIRQTSNYEQKALNKICPNHKEIEHFGKQYLSWLKFSGYLVH